MKVFFSEIKKVVESFGSHLHIDLQQRGVEFTQLFGNYNNLRDALLEKMPPMQVNRVNGSSSNGIEESELISNGNDIEIKIPSKAGESDTLLDLLGSGDDIIMSTPVVSNPINNNPPSNNQDLLDLLGGIDLSPSVAPTITTNNNILSPPVTSPITTSILDANENTTKIPDTSNFGLISDGFDMLGGPDLTSTLTTNSTTILPQLKILTVFDKNEILVQLATQKMIDYLQVIVTTNNNSLDTIDQYLFQVSSVCKKFI